MNKLKAKLKKQGGFTMVEMLIVVAIIAILVAISIPLFNSILERARHGVDQANARDAISLGYAMYLTDSNPAENFKGAGKYYQYVVSGDHSGELQEATSGGEEPKCTCTTWSGGTPTLGVNVKVDGGDVTVTLTGWQFDAAAGKTVAAP